MPMENISWLSSFQPAMLVHPGEWRFGLDLVFHVLLLSSLFQFHILQAFKASTSIGTRPLVSQWRRSIIRKTLCKTNKAPFLPFQKVPTRQFSAFNAGLRENITEDIDNKHTVSWYMLILSQTSVEAASFTYPFGGSTSRIRGIKSSNQTFGHCTSTTPHSYIWKGITIHPSDSFEKVH